MCISRERNKTRLLQSKSDAVLTPQIRTPAGGGDPAGVVVIQQREEVLLKDCDRELGGEFPRSNVLKLACCAIGDKWDIAAADTKIIELTGAESTELGACLTDTFPHCVGSKNIHSHVLFCCSEVFLSG